MLCQQEQPVERVLLQRFVHQAEFAEDFLFGNLGGNVLQRNVAGDNSKLEPVADHQHSHILDSERVLNELGMSGKAETFVGHGLFVDRTGDEDIYLAFFKLANRCLKGLDGTFCRFRSCLSRLGEGAVRETVDYVDAFCVGFGGTADGIGVHLFNFGNCLAVETEEL